MTDPRLTKLATLFTEYSTEVKPGDRVLIILYGLEGLPLLREVYKKCVSLGAHTRYQVRVEDFGRHFYDLATDKQLKYIAPYAVDEAKATDVMIQIVADKNKMEMSGVDQDKILIRRKITKHLSDIYHEARWLLFRYPTAAGAQDAGVSLEEWEDFTFSSCLVDWSKVSEEQDVLKAILEKTSQIHLVADGTDLTVDVSGQPWKKCVGKRNLPDGEIFTAPHRESPQGEILFNTPTVYRGKEFTWIKLRFDKGKVVDIDADQNVEDLHKILDTDDGARYLGEFAFGTNRNIQKPVKSILFDEKIGGSNHMALGKCYEDAPNGNDSAIHWDMIIRHAECNGKVYLDGELVQENGLWLHPDMKRFNPK